MGYMSVWGGGRVGFGVGVEGSSRLILPDWWVLKLARFPGERLKPLNPKP